MVMHKGGEDRCQFTLFFVTYLATLPNVSTKFASESKSCIPYLLLDTSHIACSSLCYFDIYIIVVKDVMV